MGPPDRATDGTATAEAAGALTWKAVVLGDLDPVDLAGGK
jgi:hypothetical protein